MSLKNCRVCDLKKVLDKYPGLEATIDNLRQQELKALQKQPIIYPQKKYQRWLYAIRVKTKYGWMLYVGQERTYRRMLKRIEDHKEQWTKLELDLSTFDFTYRQSKEEKTYEECAQQDELEYTLEFVIRAVETYYVSKRKYWVVGPYEPHGCKIFNYPDSGKEPTYLRVYETLSSTVIKG